MYMSNCIRYSSQHSQSEKVAAHVLFAQRHDNPARRILDLSRDSLRCNIVLRRLYRAIHEPAYPAEQLLSQVVLALDVFRCHGSRDLVDAFCGDECVYASGQHEL
ncbi:hypothetical protein D3C71_1439750 [compost metagenome]